MKMLFPLFSENLNGWDRAENKIPLMGNFVAESDLILLSFSWRRRTIDFTISQF